MIDLGKHEVCRISTEELQAGCLVLREYSFLENHAIFQRITIFTDLGCEDTSDWQEIPFKWSTNDLLKKQIQKKQDEGWNVVWANGDGPEPSADELMKIVRW